MRSKSRNRRTNVVQRMENVRIARAFSCRCRTIDTRKIHTSRPCNAIDFINFGESLTACEGSNPKNESAIELNSLF